MKTIALLLVLIPALAYANQCGVPPVPPPGCSYICVCDQAGNNCSWATICK